LIGRFDPVSDLKPDIDLTAIDLKRTVSRRHARVVKTETGFAILEESGAMNGTFVNGERIAGDAPRSLADGDRVRLGSVKLVFRTG
jgi:pSer/pThr/pTyr-binding forkhead associated (FHA) protein